MIKPVSISGGLVTSRHASLLEPGELVVANDSYYLPNDPALYRAWGRTRYINADGQIGGAAGKVLGVAFCPFEPSAELTSDDFLVAHKVDKYYTSVFTGRTGPISATTIDNVGNGTHLDVCHANNRWFLFNGNPDNVPNVVLKPGTGNPSSRAHGLVPVAITPTSPTVATSVGTWPRDETFWGEGRFFFFTTEVVNPGGSDELESAASIGTPPHVDLQKDANGAILFNVTVTRHASLANATATQVNVYMVKASLNQAWDNSLLARAFRVGTISVSGTAANDKIVLSANYTFFDPTIAPTVVVVSGSVANAGNMAAEDGVVATINSVLGNNSPVVDLTNFGFAATGGASIVGIKVFMRYRARAGQAVVNAQIRFGGGPTLGTVKQFSTNNENYLLDQRPWPNSETDTWGLTLTGANVNAADFGVRLTFNPSGGTSIIDVDVVKIRVYTAVLPSIGPAYSIVTQQEGNVLTVYSANTPPPVSATGDVIDGALVIDNVKNRSEIAWSLANKYDYFPSLYRLTINSKEKDQVMVIRKVGDVGLIFMLHQVVRLNYVPYSTDPEFIPGRAWEAIVPDHGCVSRQGVQVFQIPAGPTLAAYISHNGVYMNDGNRDRILTEDIKWNTTVDVTQLSKAVLINYPKDFVLVMEYVGFGTGATENNRRLVIHYHSSHRKENGRLKITGPNIMRGSCGCVAKLAAEDVMIVGHATDARLYVEDNGVSDAEGTGINMLFETGEIYAEGEGKEFTLVRSWAHINTVGANMTATLTPRYRNTGAALADGDAIAFAPTPEGLTLLQTHLGLIEAVRYRVSLPDAGANNAAVSFNHLLHDINAHGKAVD